MKFIVGDYPADIRQAIIDGYILGTINQDPYPQAYEGMHMASLYLNGQEDEIPKPVFPGAADHHHRQRRSDTTSLGMLGAGISRTRAAIDIERGPRFGVGCDSPAGRGTATEGRATASLAMKVYDYQWSTSFGMDAATAAAELVRDGIDTVLVRNQIDPLPTSGVDQEGYLASGAPVSLATDRAWSDALRAAGLRVYQTTALFFDPELLQSFPDARPVDANGDPHVGFDWYLGVCPTHDGYLAAKIDRLQRVAAELEPDGLFLSFTRYPGFWENWVPDYTFTNADRFCFCSRCRARFAAKTSGIEPRSGRCRDPGALHPGRARRRLDCLARPADRRGHRPHRRRGSRRAPAARDHAQHPGISRVRLRWARRAAGDRGAGSGDAARIG